MLTERRMRRAIFGLWYFTDVSSSFQAARQMRA
jgi:hypothetical protein